MNEQPVSDSDRLRVVNEIWDEVDAGACWVPLFVALQRYEQNARLRLKSSVLTSQKTSDTPAGPKVDHG